MNATAMLDVLTNAIGAMLTIAFLFLTLVGFPPPAVETEDLENPRVHALAVEASVGQVTDDAEASPEIEGPYFYSCERKANGCKPDSPIRLKSMPPGLERGKAAATDPPGVEPQSLVFVGVRRADAKPGGETNSLGRDTVLFLMNPPSQCISIYTVYREGAEGRARAVSISSWAGGSPPRQPLSQSRVDYFWDEHVAIAKPVQRQNALIAPRATENTDHYRVLVARKGESNIAETCLSVTAIRRVE